MCFAGHHLERIRPRAALAHFQHLVQARAGFFVLVNRTAMQRALVTGFAAERAMKLELQNVREEITRVGNISRDVIFRARIEILLAARDGRRDALIFQRAAPTTPGCNSRA